MANFSVALPTVNDRGTATGTTFMDALANFSTSFWIKTSTSTDFFEIIGKNDIASDLTGWKLFALNPGYSIQVAAGSNYRVDELTTINNGAWHSCVTTYDAAVAAKFYIDGTLASVTTFNSPVTPLTNSFLFQIGAASTSHLSYLCKLAALKCWSTTLTQGNATTLAAGGDVSVGKIGDWEFTEGSGLTATDSVTGRVMTFSAVNWSTDIPTQLQTVGGTYRMMMGVGS